MAEFNPGVDPPRGLSYAAPLIDFSNFGNLTDDYYKGAKDKQQYDLSRTFQGGIPLDPQGNPDYRAITNMLAQKGDTRAISDLAPYALAQQPGQVSPLFGGPQPGAAPMGGQPQAAPSGQPTIVRPPPQGGPAPGAPPALPSSPMYRGGDSGSGTVVSLVSGKLPDDDPKTGTVIGNIAKAVGVDPNAPLSPEQQARVARLVDSYAQRTGGTRTASLGPMAPPQAQPGPPMQGGPQSPNARVADAFSATQGGAPVPIPQPRPPGAPGPQEAPPAPQQAQPQPQGQQPQAQPDQPLMPQVRLPTNPATGKPFTDPQEAIMALRAEANRVSMSPRPIERQQAARLDEWAQQIEKSLQPITMAPGQIRVSPTGQEIYRAPSRPVRVGNQLVDPDSGTVIFKGQTTTLTPDALEDAARVFAETGKLPPNTPRSESDPTRNLIQNRASEIDRERGLDPNTRAQRWQGYATHAAGVRVLEQRAANMTLVESETKTLIPRVRALIDKVDRTRFSDLNALIRAGKMRTGNEEEVKLGIAIDSLIPVYARLLKPTGQIGVTDTENARHILEKKWADGQMRAALDQMEVERQAAKEALAEARREFSGVGGETNETPHSGAAATPPAATGGDGWTTLPGGVKIREVK